MRHGLFPSLLFCLLQGGFSYNVVDRGTLLRLPGRTSHTQGNPLLGHAEPVTSLTQHRVLRHALDHAQLAAASPAALPTDLDQNRSDYKPPGWVPQRETAEEHHPIYERIFSCAEDHQAIRSPLRFSQWMLILAIISTVCGLIGCFFEQRNRGAPLPEFHTGWKTSLWLAMCLIGGLLVNVYDIFSDVMVLLSYGYCGHYMWMFIGAAFLFAAQLYLAYEYQHTQNFSPDSSRFYRWSAKTFYFLLALSQLHLLHAAYLSWRKGAYTHDFARHKFMESVVESAPQGMFAIYVLYWLSLQYNFWLTISILGSCCSLAYGFSYWMEFSVHEQLNAEGEWVQSPGRQYKEGERFSVAKQLPFYVRWYHHMLWTSYFATDFGLRLLTIGLFLGLRDARGVSLRPWNLLVVLLLLLMYCIVCFVMTAGHDEDMGAKKEAEGMGAKVAGKITYFNHRVFHPLALVLFVHVLPADIRLLPQDQRESSMLFALHPDLRESMIKVFVPLRFLDYLGLGLCSMIFMFDAWQCAALVTLFISYHCILLPAVMSARHAGPTDAMRLVGAWEGVGEVFQKVRQAAPEFLVGETDRDKREKDKTPEGSSRQEKGA